MADNKFFTNTYITGRGRQNYLRIDNLEDPLFTSFTFDIDFNTSPLFYTINNSYFDTDNVKEYLSDKIETALSGMREKYMGKDQGYDILPVFSGSMIDDDKLGFGLQQNVYMDLPLYGATEYIYMVDKRNANGIQNDVRYNNSNNQQNKSTGEYSNNNNDSYKLGDSVKGIVNESDKLLAEKKFEQNANVIKASNDIIDNPDVSKKHNELKQKMDEAFESCKNMKIKVTINGENKECTESELLAEHNRLQKEIDKVEGGSSNISNEYKKIEEQFDKINNALYDIRSQLYGTMDGTSENGGNNYSIYNPDPESEYGKYKALEEEYQNDEFSQAMKAKSIAESENKELQDSLMEYGNIPSKKNEDKSVQTDIEQIKENTKTIITPQTVIDIVGFISGMKKMIQNYPYIIQGITGLDTAYNKHYIVKDPYLGSGEDKITLTCLESLNLRVSSMFNRYFNAVYDRQYRRERVPVNLRRFNCSVYVHDVRNFVNNIRQTPIDNRILELTDMYYSVIEFKFYDCEIVPEETGNIFNDISNEAPSEMKKTNFTFTYGNCVVNYIPN